MQSGGCLITPSGDKQTTLPSEFSRDFMEIFTIMHQNWVHYDFSDIFHEKSQKVEKKSSKLTFWGSTKKGSKVVKNDL